MKAAVAALAFLTLSACHPQCYDRESCFAMLQPQPNVYVVRRGW